MPWKCYIIEATLIFKNKQLIFDYETIWRSLHHLSPWLVAQNAINEIPMAPSQMQKILPLKESRCLDLPLQVPQSPHLSRQGTDHQAWDWGMSRQPRCKRKTITWANWERVSWIERHCWRGRCPVLCPLSSWLWSLDGSSTWWRRRWRTLLENWQKVKT